MRGPGLPAQKQSLGVWPLRCHVPKSHLRTWAHAVTISLVSLQMVQVFNQDRLSDNRFQVLTKLFVLTMPFGALRTVGCVISVVSVLSYPLPSHHSKACRARGYIMSLPASSTELGW